MSPTRKARDPARTRARLLNAAARAVMVDGVGASLETIARGAGVSKGGLLHHFQSKDDLFVALVEDLLVKFHDEVARQVDPEDLGPGRLVRAYVRASLDQLEASAVRDEATLMAALGNLPQVVRRTQAEGRRWRDEFAADGLDAARTAIIVRAADGMAAAALFDGHVASDEIDMLRSELIALSMDPGPLPGRPATDWTPR